MITLNGTTGITTPDVNSDGLTVDSTTLVVDEANNRVGIGTSSPSYKLDVSSSSNVVAKFGYSGGASGYVYADSNIVSYGSSTSGANSINFYDSLNLIRLYTNGSERARIDSSGNLLVGTTSSGISNTLSTVIETSGPNNSRITVNHSSIAGSSNNSNYMRFTYGGNLIGRIVQASTTTVSYTTSSDYRLKENVVGVTGASARVQQLNPVRFNFIADPDTTVDGFLAHEVQDVVPEAISGTKDEVDAEGNPEYQGIDQSKLVPLLTAALQEALTKIETLEARVAALEAA